MIIFAIYNSAKADLTLWYLDGTTLKPVDPTWTVVGVSGGGSNWKFLTANAITPTSTIGVILNASSTFLSTLTATGGFIGNLTGTASNNLLRSDWFSTTTQISITSIPTLLITESQISNLGNYLTYPVATSTYLQISYASTTYLTIASTTPYKITSLPNLTSVGTLATATGNISLWTNDSGYITWTNASSTYLAMASTTPYKITGLPNLVTVGTIGTGVWNGTKIDISDYTNLTAGDALTLTGDDINFDGGASPGGSLGGTWASPTIDDLFVLNTSDTMSGYLTAAGFTGNASTSVTLKTNPADCSAGQFATTIAANGDLTCATAYDALGDISLTAGNVIVGNNGNIASATTTLFVNPVNGYVGIASTTPTSILSVNGDMYITGEINTPNGEQVNFRGFSKAIASSTWQGMGTSSDFFYPPQAITITEIACVEKNANATNYGTTTVYLTDGTNALDSIACGYTLVKDSTLTNNTWNADEKMTWVMKSTEGTPNGWVLRVKYFFNSD